MKKSLTLFFFRYKIVNCTIMGAYAPISQQKDLQMLNISTLDKSCQEAFKNKFVIF